MNVYVLIGMGLQAVIAGTLAGLGVIKLTPTQQFVAAGFFFLMALIFKLK